MKIHGMFAAMVLTGGALFLGACSPQPWTGVGTSSYIVAAPPEQVFAFLYDAQNEKSWNPNLKEINCQGDGLGRTCTWKSEGFGEAYEGRSQNMEFIPGRKLVSAASANNGNLSMITTTLFLPDPQGTKVVGMTEVLFLKLPSGLSELPHHLVLKKLEEYATANQQRIKEAVEKMPDSAAAVSAVTAREVISTLNGTNTWTVEIKAPVEQVFAFITDPANWSQWHDQSAKLSNLQGRGLGQTNDWDVSVGGISFRGQSVIVDYQPNVKQVEIFSGDVQGTNTWLFLPGEGKTKVIYVQNASIASPGMTRAQWDGLMKASQDAGEQELQKAKEILEQ